MTKQVKTVRWKIDDRYKNKYALILDGMLSVVQFRFHEDDREVTVDFRCVNGEEPSEVKLMDMIARRKEFIPPVVRRHLGSL
jgi:hypothetical protein